MYLCGKVVLVSILLVLDGCMVRFVCFFVLFDYDVVVVVVVFVVKVGCVCVCKLVLVFLRFVFWVFWDIKVVLD